MTLDWQLMVVAFVAMCLRLVMTGTAPDVGTDGEQLHRERSAAFHPPQSQPGVQTHRHGLSSIRT
jgi:hypothetical protein